MPYVLKNVGGRSGCREKSGQGALGHGWRLHGRSGLHEPQATNEQSGWTKPRSGMIARTGVSGLRHRGGVRRRPDTWG